MSRPGRRGPLVRWVGGSAGDPQGRGRVAMGTPELVVLQSTAAGLSCRQRQGWDDTSIPRPGVGCLPRWEGSSCGCWPPRRRGSSGRGSSGRGRGQSAGLPVVGELAEQVVRGSQIRNRAGRRSRRWGLDLGRVAKVVRVPSSSSESVLDLQAAPDLVTRVSSGTERGLTPTTRVAPPDPGHRTKPTRVCSQASTTPPMGRRPAEWHGQHPDCHQTTDLAVGGSNPSRRAKTAAERRYSKRSRRGRLTYGCHSLES
jgi:hypothetical protein